MPPFPTRRTRSRYSAPGRAASLRRARYTLPATPARSGPGRAGRRSTTTSSSVARLANLRGSSTAGQAATAGAMARLYRTTAPGARHGNSGGFLKATKKFKPNKKILSGCASSYEFAGVKTSTDLCSFGHTTNCYNHTYRALWDCVLKKLLDGAKVKFEAMLDYPFVGYSGTEDVGFHDSITVWWKKRDYDGAPYDETLKLNNTDTVHYCCNWLTSNSRPWNNPGYSEKGNMLIFRIEFRPAAKQDAADTTSVPLRRAIFNMIDLTNCSVYISAKSALKMQNRTVEEAGDDESDVNNVPLYGRSIEGNGAGPIWKNQKKISSVSFLGDVKGIINVNESTDMQEPPNPEEFHRVQKVGKVKIEPGEIRTSVISHAATKMFNTWYRELNQYQMLSESSPETGQLNPDLRIGKYRLFHIEKMLAAGTAYIKTAFEIQQNFVSRCKVKFPQTIIQEHYQNHSLTY